MSLIARELLVRPCDPSGLLQVVSRLLKPGVDLHCLFKLKDGFLEAILHRKRHAKSVPGRGVARDQRGAGPVVHLGLLRLPRAFQGQRKIEVNVELLRKQFHGATIFANRLVDR